MTSEEPNGHNEQKLSFPIKYIGCLSNFEVHEYLKEIKNISMANPERKNALKSNRQLSTLVYEALQYFKETPAPHQTKEGIQEFLQKIQPYNLTKHEKLTMINTCPTGAVDVEAIVEESEERLTEEQTEEILDVIKNTISPSTQGDSEMDQG